MAKGGWKGTRPTAFGVRLEEATQERAQEIAAFALQQVIFGSPVDQGAYKANHRVTLNGRTLAVDPFEFDPAGNQTLQAGMAEIARADHPFVEIVIQNNLPYGERLENGHSGQAPTGVYGNAINSTAERFR